jgi:hypothetical protein
MGMSAGMGARLNLGITAALCMVLTAACASAAPTAQPVDQAKVTGYTSASPSAQSSGPVSVTVHGTSAAGLYRLVEGLTASSGAPCMEEPQLYRITFTPAAGTGTVNGYACEGYVTTTSGGSTRDWTDKGCTLLLAVRRVLPASATATQQTNNPCPS